MLAHPQVLPGFFMAQVDDVLAYQCPFLPGCLGGKLKFGDTSCKHGHSGLLCGRCIDGWYRSRGRCMSCAAVGVGDYESAMQATMSAGGAALFIVALVIVLYVERPSWLNRFAAIFARFVPKRFRRHRTTKHIRRVPKGDL